VLSAANEPATYRATGEGPGDDAPESGLFVRSQEEHLRVDGRVVITVAPEPGQETLVQRILDGTKAA